MDDPRKNYRAWDAQQCSQQAISPQEALPEDDLVFFLLDTIPQLDLSAFHRHYAAETRGQPPFDVTMMVALLVYAYCVGVCSSRKIAARVVKIVRRTVTADRSGGWGKSNQPQSADLTVIQPLPMRRYFGAQFSTARIEQSLPM
jgi:hypothetical protein